MRKDYTPIKRHDELMGYEGLAFAIILQAADDFRELCKGKFEDADVNFYELKRFFLRDGRYLSFGLDMDLENIYKLLEQERA